MGLFPWRKLYILINLVHFHNFDHKYASFCSFLHTVEDSFIVMFAVKVVKTMMKVPPWKQNNLTCLTWLVSIPAVYAYVFIYISVWSFNCGLWCNLANITNRKENLNVSQYIYYLLSTRELLQLIPYVTQGVN